MNANKIKAVVNTLFNALSIFGLSKKKIAGFIEEIHQEAIHILNEKKHSNVEYLARIKERENSIYIDIYEYHTETRKSVFVATVQLSDFVRKAELDDLIHSITDKEKLIAYFNGFITSK